jgi:uncharacterized membrane protein YfcA
MNQIVPPALTYFNGFLLFTTSFIAGGLNAVAGGGSFITFPALIFTGVSPIVANATNTTAMWVASFASVGAYRRDFMVARRVLMILSITSLVGGGLGSIALLYISPDIFKKLIPYLLLLATGVFIFGESIKQWLQSLTNAANPQPPRLFYLVIAQLVIAIYGGFFGAGAGILMLAVLTFFGFEGMSNMNALKAFLGTCLNGISVVVFIFAGLITWPQVILMSVGGSMGGYFIARFARKIPSQIIHWLVSIVAISMTTYFFIKG